jgi:hypothetical protein
MIVYANGRVIATDLQGDAQNIAVIGEEQDTLKVADDEARDLLYNVIKELKILNLHMSIVTDNDIRREEVEV